jgi:hypothetical protein
MFTKNPFAGSASTQDADEIPKPNIERKTVFGAVDMDYLTNLEKNV